MIRYRLSLSQLLFAAVALSMSPCGISEAEPPVLRPTDGAPGENRFPGATREIAQNDVQEAVPDEEEEAKPVESKSQVRLDAVDHRAPVQKARQTAWERATESAKNLDWRRMVEHLAPIIGGADALPMQDSMVRQPDGSIQSGRLQSVRLLLQLPEAHAAERTEQLQAQGEKVLAEALHESNLRRLEQVAVHYAGTPIGFEASQRLIALLIDRGAFAPASRWIELLKSYDTLRPTSPSNLRKQELLERVIRSEERTGDVPRNADSPLEQIAASIRSPKPDVVSELPVLFGNESRHSIGASQTPLLIRRWSFSTTSDRRLFDTVNRLIEDFALRRRAAVPAGMPLFVGGRIVLRTMRGLEVRDAETGELYWSTGSANSIDRLMSRNSDSGGSEEIQSDVPVSAVAGLGPVTDPTGGPLGQLLFQNAAYNQLSSDGERVYFIDDDPVYTLGRTALRVGKSGSRLPQPGSALSNHLSACELDSGSRVWKIGGLETPEPFGNELAGWFFMGTPLPSNGDLFVLAQKEEALRLFCLDPTTGQSRWSQQLGWSGWKPDRDLNRRLWSAQLAISQGTIVCPTTSGWLIAVDRYTGTLLWATRFSNRKAATANSGRFRFGRNRGVVEVAARPVGSEWTPSAPIIAGNRIFITPPEPKDETRANTALMACFDLHTGRRLWEQRRGDALYLATADSNRFILVRPDSVAAISGDGKEVWSTAIPDDDGQPSGRGVTLGNRFWLPTHTGKLLGFEIENGSVADSFSPAGGNRSLGNLSVYRDLLISSHPATVAAFELKEPLERKLAALPESDKALPQGALLSVQLALANGEVRQAATTLLRLASQAGSTDRESIRSLSVRAARALLDIAPQQSLDLLRGSDGLSDGSRSIQHERLIATVLLKLGRNRDAFDQLMKIVDSHDKARFVRSDDSRVDVSLDTWLTSTFRKLWDDAAEKTRTSLSETIREAFQQGGSGRRSTDRLVKLFEFHEEAASARHVLLREAEQGGLTVDVDYWLRQIADSSDRSEAATALVSRLELDVNHSDRRIRTALQQRLANDYSDVQLPDGLTVSQWLSKHTNEQVRPEQARPFRWDVSKPAVIRSGVPRTLTVPRAITDDFDESPIGPMYRVEMKSDSSGTQRLHVIRTNDESLYWSVALRSQRSAGVGMEIRRSGHLLLVLSGTTLSGLSVPDRRIVWTVELESESLAQAEPIEADRPLLLVKDWLKRLRPTTRSALPVVNEDYFCLQGSRSLKVFDTRTGLLRWKLSPVRDSHRAAEHDSIIHVLRQSGRTSAAYRAGDGRPVDVDSIAAFPVEYLRISDNRVVTIDAGDDEVRLRGSSGGDEKTAWEHTWPTKAKFARITSTEVGIVQKFGKFQVLDLETGSVTDFEKIPAKTRTGRNKFSVLCDAARYFVFIRSSKEDNVPTGSLKSVSMSGAVAVYERDSGKRLWSGELGNQAVITEQFRRNPFLILFAEESLPVLSLGSRTKISLLDRNTGKLLLERTIPGRPGYHSLRIDEQRQFVDLLSRNDRLRISASSE